MTTMAARGAAGALVREWRLRRRLSQLDLALETGVSARHLSFVETGRARPSPQLLLALADRLEVPMREQNALLLAAGYAPRYGQTPLDDPAMASVRAGLRRMLSLHDPYPGVLIDLSWNVVMANEAAARLTEGLPAALTGPPMNVFRACLHPDGLARSTLNFPEWAGYLLGQLSRLTMLTADPQVCALADEVSRYPNVAAPGRPGDLGPAGRAGRPWHRHRDLGPAHRARRPWRGHGGRRSMRSWGIRPGRATPGSAHCGWHRLRPEHTTTSGAGTWRLSRGRRKRWSGPGRCAPKQRSTCNARR